MRRPSATPSFAGSPSSGPAVDLVLALGKIGGGYAAQSQSLVADGVHSLSDLVTDMLVLLAAKLARAKPDAEHPYGHERIETAATVALGVVLILIGAGIAFDSRSGRLFHPEELQIPAWWAMAIAAVSVGFKEGVYHYTIRAATALPLQAPGGQCVARAKRRGIVDRGHRRSRRRVAGARLSRRDSRRGRRPG